ncbi:hypothetical protein SAMN02799630_01322 [Paenibacillus sp. UNCCL117]|uniref:hypothetical protein n=1 Tax=unclassified Paenibacillus TaxID=185978 RepID=UPI00087FD566|nr:MULTISPECIES: hypothetical protein [unclassified Paenibacillus]SDC73185.1 hypothetical protein SAMN04488602_103300 [Paenibacillus sp. cl123]SFW24963.1 hypothetical protein SAMN02799630_01322 [Paenibacillus sp. UNCCL117]
MTTYWLVPAAWEGHDIVLGRERLKLSPEELRNSFCQSLQAAHPRLLLLFKAHLLLSDDSAEACGADGLAVALSESGDIRLSGASEEQKESGEPSDALAWSLSHCGEAYLNGLMSPSEAVAKLALVRVEPEARSWYEAMRDWLAEGRIVMMLRED